MPNPDDPRPAEDRDAVIESPTESERRQFAEQEASKALRKVWSVPEGRFPLVTLAIVLCAVIVTGFWYLSPEPVARLFYATSGEIWLERKWWGLFGSVFIHSGVPHLVFNCYWIWILGRLLERELGPLRYLGLFLAVSWFSSIAEFAWEGQQGVGLSGVGYAFFGFLVVNRSHHLDFERVLAGGTVPLFFGWLVVCFPLTYMGVMRVANFAHLGGLVAGCALGAIAYPHPRRTWARVAAVSLGLASFVPLFWAPWHAGWQVAHAYRALVGNDEDTALVSFEKARAKDSKNEWAANAEATIRLRRGQYALAREILTPAASSNSASVEILNNLAWLLATCPVPEIRDGARAVDFGTRACTSDKFEHASCIDTLAAAHAEAGNFEDAERFAVQAVAKGGDHAPILQKHLDSFRAHQPWREPEAAKAK